MSEDPQNRIRHKADQISTPEEFQFGIELEDIDQVINDYMIDVVIPKLEQDSDQITVPLIYGNAERWKSIQKDGYFRDKKGQIQIPLIMFKRTSVDRDDTMRFFSREVSYPTFKKYSQKNRYDKFSALNNIQPTYEAYNVTMPEYVTLTYDVRMWTNFTEHMNKLIENFRYASDTYWGDKDKYKFRTFIESFNTDQSMAAGSERIIQTDFQMEVKGYIIPKTFNNQPTTKKSYTVKEVKVTQEVDMTGRKIDNNLR